MTNIGVFDSGLGGISVLNTMAKDIRANFYYFGDTLRVPYGDRKDSEILEFSTDIVNFLEDFDIDYYVIACNTISVVATDYLEKTFKKRFIPITHMGVELSKKYDGNFLLLATSKTVDSHFYKDKLGKLNKKVLEVKAADLVPLIENGLSDQDALNKSIDKYVKIANKEKIDNIILGCTHFPIIKEHIENRLTYRANIINPASFIKEEIKTNDSKSFIKIYMSKETKACQRLIPDIMDFDYNLTYLKELR